LHLKAVQLFDASPAKTYQVGVIPEIPTPRLHAELPITLGELELDPARRIVSKAGSVLRLTPKECDLLHYLMRHLGIPIALNALGCRLSFHTFDAVFQPAKLRTKRSMPELSGGIGFASLHFDYNNQPSCDGFQGAPRHTSS
jgi:hypothetical protein